MSEPTTIDALSDQYDRDDFDCGVAELNDFLKKQARSFVKRGLCAVFVMTIERKVIGYYSLSAASVQPEEMPPSISKRHPFALALPCVLLGRFAIDKGFQGGGLGVKLLAAALKQAFEASRKIGAFCVIVNVKNETVKSFYLKYDFLEMPENNMRLFLPMKTIERSLELARDA